MASLEHWTSELAQEIFERIEKDELENNRRPKQMVVSFTQEIGSEDVVSSRTTTFNQLDVVRISSDAIDLIKKNTNQFLKPDQNTVLHNPIKFLGLSVGKFEDLDQKQKNTINSMFSNQIKNNLVKREKNISSGESVKPSEPAISPVKILKNEESKQTNNGSKNYIQEMFKRSVKNETVVKPIQSDTNFVVPKIENQKAKSSFFAKLASPGKRIDENDYEIGESSKSVDIVKDSVANTIVQNSVTNESFFGKVSSPVKSDDSLETSDPDHVSCENNQALVDSPVASEDILPVLKESISGSLPAYKQTYAEFQMPTNMSDLYEQCSQCNKKVLLSEIQSHNDAHFAFLLSQEQRQEFRSQKIRQPPTLSQSPALKKVKLDRSVLTPKSAVTSNLIQKFLTKPTPPSDNEIKCPECDSIIGIDKVVEHTDYHAAKKLHLELNKETITHSSLLELKSTPNSGKSKKDSKNRVASVASFFQQQGR